MAKLPSQLLPANCFVRVLLEKPFSKLRIQNIVDAADACRCVPSAERQQTTQMVVHRRFGRCDMCGRHLILLHCHTPRLRLHHFKQPPHPHLPLFSLSLSHVPSPSLHSRPCLLMGSRRSARATLPQSTHVGSVGAHVGAQMCCTPLFSKRRISVRASTSPVAMVVK